MATTPLGIPLVDDSAATDIALYLNNIANATDNLLRNSFTQENVYLVTRTSGMSGGVPTGGTGPAFFDGPFKKSGNGISSSGGNLTALTTGIYRLLSSCQFGSGTGAAWAYFNINGTDSDTGKATGTLTTSHQTFLNAHDCIPLNTGDVVTVKMACPDGANAFGAVRTFSLHQIA